MKRFPDLSVIDLPIMIMMVGLPASGKSTWVKSFLSNSLKDIRRNETKEFKIISTDDIIEEMAKLEGVLDNNGNVDYNKAYYKFNGFSNKEMKRRLSDAISNRNNFIWDQTNMSEKIRRKRLKRVDEYYKISVIFSISDEELKRRSMVRLQETGKSIPDHIIESFASIYERPSKTEGFDFVYEV